MPEKTWLLWDNAVPRVPSVLEHEFSQSDKSMSYEHVCLVTANSGKYIHFFATCPLQYQISCSAACFALTSRLLRQSAGPSTKAASYPPLLSCAVIFRELPTTRMPDAARGPSRVGSPFSRL